MTLIQVSSVRMLSPIRVKGFRCRAVRGLGGQQQCAGKEAMPLPNSAARTFRPRVLIEKRNYTERILGQSSINTYKRLTTGNNARFKKTDHEGNG